MAEQERKTFKWGDQEYLLDDLLKLHAAQENNFYDFARNRGQYDDNALMGLRQAITNRINAVKSGEAFEGDGVLGTDKVDNTRIQTQKKGLFRKEKYVDQDNTEWAKYYLNKLVGGLKSYKKEEKAPDNLWNLDKHGFGAYLKSLGYTPQSIFEGYDKRDANNPEAKRGFTERDNHSFTNLQAWRNGLKDYDFTKDDNPHNDTLMARVDAFLKDPNAYDRVQRGALLREVGAGDYVDAYTSDRWDLSKSNSQLDAEAKAAEEKRKKEEEINRYKQYVKDTHSAFKSLSDNNFGGTYFTSPGDGLFTMSDSEYESWLNTHTNDKDAYMRNLQESYYKNPFDTKIAGEYLPLAARFGALKDVTIDGKAYKYDPRTIDRTKNRFVAFDPDTGETRHAFLGDIEEEMQALKRKWRIANGYEDEADKYTAYNEKGGILTMQTGGGFNLAQAVNRDLEERNKNRAKETGNTEKVQKARDRVVSNGDDSFTSEEASIGQPDAGFTAAEKVRLGSILADIGSLILDPISGTAVGLVSTGANFVADVMDDGMQLSDWGNLAVNAGFDLLGAIPIFGDAVGTGAKITRKLAKFAPRVMAGLAAYQGVANFDGMMDSFSKFLSDDKDQKLTVQDWRNIAQGVSLVTGGVRATRNKVAQHKMKKQAKVDGVLGINVRNRNGDIEQILVDGKTAEHIKKNRNNIEEIEKTLNGIEGYEGKFGAGKDYEINTKNGKWQNPFGKDDLDGWQWRGFRKPGMADINHHYDFNRVRGYASSLGLTPPVAGKFVNNIHKNMAEGLNRRPVVAENLQGKMSKTDIDADYKQLLKDQGIDTQIDALKKEMGVRNQYQTSAKEKLTKAQEAFNTNQNRTRNLASEADLQANKTLYESQIAGMPDHKTLRDASDAYNNNKRIVDSYKAETQRLSDVRNRLLSQVRSNPKVKALNKRIKDINTRLAEINNKPRKSKKDLQEESTLTKELQAKIKDLDVKTVQAEKRINAKFNREQARLTSEYNQARGKMNTAKPVADMKAKLTEYQGKLKGVENDLATYADVRAQEPILQQRVDRWQNYLNARNPQSAHTKAYTDLQNMLNNLRTTHSQIGGRNLSWDMDDILKQYNLKPSEVFKQGGSINRNKINKFLNYAKG